MMRKCTAYAQAAKNRLEGSEIPPSGNSDGERACPYGVYGSFRANESGPPG